MATELQSALINAGMETITFTAGESEHEIPINKLPDASLIRILQYGKRMFNDYVNSAGHAAEPKDGESLDEAKARGKAEAVETWIKKAQDGTLGQAAGGRSRISPLEREIRNIVESYLRQDGMKATDAKKATKKPEKAFRGYLQLKLKAAGKKGTSSEVDTAFEKNWPKIESQAQAILDQQKANDIEI